MKRVGLMCGAAVVVAGCVSGPVIQDSQWRSGVPASFKQAAIGPVPTVIVGNPFAAPDAAVAGAIANVSTGTYGGSPAVFVPAPADVTGLRVVWDLSPGAGQGSDGLCAGARNPAPASTPVATRILGVFCSGGLPLADVSVRLAQAPSGLDDPAWRQAFPAALTAMIPQFDPYEDMD